MVDFELWGAKGLTVVNTHERRDDFQMHCCENAMYLLSSGLWNYKGVTNNIYSMEEFDKANYDMDNKPKGYIKALVRCSY
jgi:threonine dehydrogenase-like Zn-dependent dehydrogenase